MKSETWPWLSKALLVGDFEDVFPLKASTRVLRLSTLAARCFPSSVVSWFCVASPIVYRQPYPRLKCPAFTAESCRLPLRVHVRLTASARARSFCLSVSKRRASLSGKVQKNATAVHCAELRLPCVKLLCRLNCHQSLFCGSLRCLVSM